MDSENVFKIPSAPSTPLRQLSAEQINQQRIPQSPSLHSYLAENDRSHHRSRESISSDVQSKVALLNSLSNPASPTRPSRGPATPANNAAFQRAVLGYEESQASLATAKADIERLRQQVDSGQRRERMVSERIESLMEQLSVTRDNRESDKKAYVSEIKKSRKQGYQAEMAAMETREELKEARMELKKAQAELEKEKKKKEEARQEAFERAYTVSGLTEELELLKQTIKSLEQERDAAVTELRLNDLQQRDVMLMADKAAQTDALQFPSPKEDVDATPRASKRSKTMNGDHICSQAPSTVEMPLYSDFVVVKSIDRHLDGETFTLEDHIKALYREILFERKQNADHEDMMHFMNMQCQFKACPCRQAERNGTRFVHDFAYDQKMHEEHKAKRRKMEEDKKFNQLPPEPSPEMLAKAAEEPVVEDAVRIPLPSPKAKELSSRDISPEPTALLEEMTQVIIEPATDNEQFRFSTRSDGHARAIAPSLRHIHSATDTADSDLFNLSPPKHALARPSTAMGIVTLNSPMSSLKSPIRLVPDSPQPTSLPIRTATPEGEPMLLSSTTRVALKDSPSVLSHRRTQSRPNIKQQSRTTSPLVSAKSNPDFSKSTSASPAASTVFPVTPVIKHARSQTHHNISQTVTTTTTIPVRGLDNDGDLEFHSHTPGSYSHTQPIPVPDQSSNSSAEQLAHVPGTPVSREAALAQIRARRDRARSVNLKKEGNGVKSAPGSARRGIALRDAIERGREGREVSMASMASAPGRI